MPEGETATTEASGSPVPGGAYTRARGRFRSLTESKRTDHEAVARAGTERAGQVG